MNVSETEMMETDKLSIPELYQKCLNNENDWVELDLEPLKISLYKAYVFGQPEFSPAPNVSECVSTSAGQKERELRITMRLYEGNKYREIRELLKNAPDSRTRRFVIAWWLAQEKICDPEEIIGREEVRRQAKKMLSLTEFRHADRVRAWIPYFCRLLRDRRTARSTSTLRGQGYENSAIQSADKKRSPAAAACEWLADNRAFLNITSAALANAYSRVYGPKRLRTKAQQAPRP
jgi:hypothetical protein